MKKQFVACATLAEAQDAMPWACKIVPAEGGFLGFESINDFATWENQK